MLQVTINSLYIEVLSVNTTMPTGRGYQGIIVPAVQLHKLCRKIRQDLPPKNGSPADRPINQYSSLIYGSTKINKKALKNKETTLVDNHYGRSKFRVS